MAWNDEDDFLGLTAMLDNINQQRPWDNVGLRKSWNVAENKEQMIQKQPSVEADQAKVPIVEFPAGTKMTSEKQIIQKLNNDAANQQNEVRKMAQSNYADTSKEVAGHKGTMQKYLDDLQNYPKPYEIDPTLKIELEKAQKSAEYQEGPQRDMWSEAILSFAPGIFGALTGESGAISQLKSGETARNNFDKVRKDETDRIKNKNELSQNRLEKYIKMDSSARDSHQKEQQLMASIRGNQISATGEMMKATSGERDKNQEAAVKATGEISDTQRGAGKEGAASERADLDRAAGIQRAKIQGAATGLRLQHPSEGERKGALQYGLTNQALLNYDDFIKKNNGVMPSMGDKFFRLKNEIMGGSYGNTTLSDMLNSKDFDPRLRLQFQIERQYLESIGRILSGAAIRPDEWLSLREQYFPSYGDSADSLLVKAKQRQVGVDGVKIIAGRAAKDVAPPVSVIQQGPQLSREQLIEAVKAKRAKEKAGAQ